MFKPLELNPVELGELLQTPQGKKLDLAAKDVLSVIKRHKLSCYQAELVFSITDEYAKSTPLSSD